MLKKGEFKGEDKRGRGKRRSRERDGGIFNIGIQSRGWRGRPLDVGPPIDRSSTREKKEK